MIEELVNQLKDKRIELERANQQVKDVQLEFEQTNEYLNYCQAKAYKQTVKEELEEIDEYLRVKALEQYQDTGDKSIADGIKIILVKTLDYRNEQAINWAIENARDTMLNLNKSLFEKHAKAVAETTPLDFVYIAEIPAVRIAKKL